MSSPNLIQDIALRAELLFRDHVLCKLVSPSSLLLPPSSGADVTPGASYVPLNDALLDFAHDVVLEVHARNWGSGTYPARERAQTLPLFLGWSIDAASMFLNPPPKVGPPGSLGGYGAWLYIATPGIYYVIFDEPEIRRRCGQLKKNEYETRTKLFLHELGHLVKDQSQLFDVTPPSRAVPADPLMELHAWCFAGILVGLCAGCSAAGMRHADSPDRAWELW